MIIFIFSDATSSEGTNSFCGINKYVRISK